MRNLTLVLNVCVFLVSSGAVANNSGDAIRGKQVFKKCASCHMVGTEARKRVGPPLNNIMSARAGGMADFKYSKALRKAAHEDLHWTPETLDVFLEDPRGYLPKTKMSFRGLKNANDRADIIAYLATFSGASMAAKIDEGFTVPSKILGIEGDMEYGEYLSSECTTCHQVDGDNDGIPAIIGWETKDFVTAMHAYREKHRQNPVMQMISGRLSNDEIAALAAYFENINN
ncbi:MAG: c-type cytochrome [Hyphomicrobiales bacterium]|nr:c-type cytochrome [Hyphomicrobiales bacterium]MCP5000988.1 c-type cytochrome [Hyphomicrobiales bacterium]